MQISIDLQGVWATTCHHSHNKALLFNKLIDLNFHRRLALECTIIGTEAHYHCTCYHADNQLDM